MTGRRSLPVAGIVAAYTAGEGTIAVAERFGCSPTGVRQALRRAGVPLRPQGGVRAAIADADIVAMRDERRLSWTDISTTTGLNEEALRRRYREATGTTPDREWHRDSRRHPDLDHDQLQQLNSVIDHRDTIVTAWLTGQATAVELARQHGISESTVRRWAGQHRSRP